ncbi:carboxyltransferase domain-containing protein [Parasphingorhabdus sp.]|uniref:5-oxoprolinase subunit B family protein n=1 Tax=Parasphingorhabdus sp. TaxID=2709688 RepID=UPI00326309D4
MEANPEIYVCDDWVNCEVRNRSDIHAFGRILQESGCWQDIIPGLDSIAVQFDPARYTPEEARNLFANLLQQSPKSAPPPPSLIEIPICYDEEFGYDIERVSELLKRSSDEFMAWHSSLSFTVTMLGFMPGFAYLACNQTIPDIGRLDSPRQKVAAGSIGMIGVQGCIYPFDSPGGWPIVGRTPLSLFEPGKSPPNILQPDQAIRFTRIDHHQFDRIAKDHNS